MKPTLVALAVALASGALHADNELNTLLIEGQAELQTTDKARVSEAEGQPLRLAKTLLKHKLRIWQTPCKAMLPYKSTKWVALAVAPLPFVDKRVMLSVFE
ncbi:MAG: hypothetical protein NWP51_13030 [Marinomonas hwangdonensis]|nr:hypothetical protein [Marinomonas hwangdonensis]